MRMGDEQRVGRFLFENRKIRRDEVHAQIRIRREHDPAVDEKPRTRGLKEKAVHAENARAANRKHADTGG